MQAMRVALSAVALLATAGCASLQVRTDYDPRVSFEQLRTYDWTTETVGASGHPAVNSPLVEGRIRHAVDSTLAHMGYRRVTGGAPDFRITHRIVAEGTTRLDPSYGYGGYGYSRFYGFGYPGYGSFGRGYRGFGYGRNASGSVREYVEARLVLDVVDARTNELIWRGWATDDLDRNPTPEAIQQYIAKSVEKILGRFPQVGSAPRPLVSP